jgi:hypothetical protein
VSTNGKTDKRMVKCGKQPIRIRTGRVDTLFFWETIIDPSPRSGGPASGSRESGIGNLGDRPLFMSACHEIELVF